MKQHYHVLSGLNGLYMPDSNELYSTRAAAEESAKWNKEQYLEGGCQVVGSVRKGLDGYLARFPGQEGWTYSITITVCKEEECLCTLCKVAIPEDDYTHEDKPVCIECFYKVLNATA